MAARKTDIARTPNTLARHLFSTYEHFRVEHMEPFNCNHVEVWKEIGTTVAGSQGLLRCEELGKSLEGRSINLVSCGKGNQRVLLWSQMHGDEYTATLALLDIFNFIARSANGEKWIREMLDETTLYFLPMLNPDGAERRQRRTAQNIDMNRDARTLMTPEARLLRQAHQKLKPQFAFNLHDQELSTVGDTPEVAAIAFLAPSLDRKRSTPHVRIRAMRVAALMTRVLCQFIPKNIAAYNDTFEPRAFGDNMQQWGTSTVLIESGHWPKDRKKSFVRKLNFVCILTALRCIGNGSYQDAELDLYKELPQNGKGMYDIILRDIVLEHPAPPTGELHAVQRWSHTVDIGLTIPPNSHPDPLIVTVRDVGDLSTCPALEIIQGHKRKLASSFVAIDQSLPLPTLLDALQLYHH
jgi:hypothetical protein